MKNSILAGLPEQELEFVSRHLKEFALKHKAVLFAPGDVPEYVHFPVEGIVSLLGPTRSGLMVESSMVGREGVLGGTTALGHFPATSFATVQVPGRSLRMSRRDFRESFAQLPTLRDLVFRSMESLFAQAQQAAVCNALHNVNGRMCRWLLEAHARTQARTMALTQEFLAQMLGVQRTTITLIAGELQEAQIIKVHRGRVEILDLDGLRRHSCECHAVLQNQRDQLLVPASRPVSLENLQPHFGELAGSAAAA